MEISAFGAGLAGYPPFLTLFPSIRVFRICAVLVLEGYEETFSLAAAEL